LRNDPGDGERDSDNSDDGGRKEHHAGTHAAPSRKRPPAIHVMYQHHHIRRWGLAVLTTMPVAHFEVASLGRTPDDPTPRPAQLITLQSLGGSPRNAPS
jgi:hypothetical protein